MNLARRLGLLEAEAFPDLAPYLLVVPADMDDDTRVAWIIVHSPADSRQRHFIVTGVPRPHDDDELPPLPAGLSRPDRRRGSGGTVAAAMSTPASEPRHGLPAGGAGGPADAGVRPVMLVPYLDMHRHGYPYTAAGAGISTGRLAPSPARRSPSAFTAKRANLGARGY